MEFFKAQANFDFIGVRRFWITMSIIVNIGCLLSIAFRSFDYGIDFAGGTELQLAFAKPVDTATLREAVTAMGYEKAEVVALEGMDQSAYLVSVSRYGALTDDQTAKLRTEMQAAFGAKLKDLRIATDSGERVFLSFAENPATPQILAVLEKVGAQNAEVRRSGRMDIFDYTIELESMSGEFVRELARRLQGNEVKILGVEAVGAQVGQQMRLDGLLAVIYAILGIVVYVAFRFDLRFAPGAVIALLHDAIFTAGFFSITGIEFNMTALAAVLTIVGYSVNDTIVVYDRIRENIAKYPGEDLAAVMNRSINETLSRTILTAGTTWLAAAILLAFGGPTLFGFALAMCFGIIVGTYSSIFISAPAVLLLADVLGTGEPTVAEAKSLEPQV